MKSKSGRRYGGARQRYFLKLHRDPDMQPTLRITVFRGENMLLEEEIVSDSVSSVASELSPVLGWHRVSTP